MKNVKMNKWLLTILYFLAFILLREWLLPVVELTETGYLSLFLIFIGFSFVLSLLNCKWRAAIPLKLIYIFGSVHYIFTGSITVSLASAQLLTNNILLNIPFVMSGQWEELTNTLKTILFFLLIWMITYLIRYWIEIKKSIFLFYFTTVAFIATVDTFSPYSADRSIFMIMVVGLLLLGILTISRLAARHGLSISTRQITAVSIPLVLALVLSGALMIVLPKQAPIWADPVPFIKSMAGGAGDGTGNYSTSKSGYDPDDTRLGGPFLQDDSLVFEATVDNKQYWKVETKDTYTSKGWEQSSLGKASQKYYPGFTMSNRHNLEGEEEIELKQANLAMTEMFPFITYPYGITTIHTDHEAVSIIHNEEIGKYETEIEGESRPLDSYGIDFIEEKFSLKELRAAQMGDMPQTDEFSQYLQLPETLPGRVQELAETISASSDNVYDKAKSIERYFGRSGFVYDRSDVAVPEEDEDYVDQFLFDTKKGYCDNFSTSMVVMLRTLDIPARWVKGFAPGEISRSEEGERVYRVSNNEAHSWVEAYMPGIGWVPFEPTIGFSSTTQIDYDIDLNLDDPEVQEMPEKERAELEREIKKKEMEEKRNTSEIDFSFEVNEWLKNNTRWILLGVGVAALLAWRLYIIRRKWMPKIMIRLYRTDNGNWESYVKQYNSLLKQLELFGLKRDGSETLSAYALKVDRYFGGERMRKMTNAYEKGFYGGIKEGQDWQRLQEMWEDLVLRTSD